MDCGSLPGGGQIHDFDAGLEDVVGVFHDEVGFSAAEEFAEHFLEFDADRGEGFGEADAGVIVDLGDELFELALGVDDVGEGAGDGGLAFFELGLFEDGVEVDVAEAGDFAFELVDFGGDGVPVAFPAALPDRWRRLRGG